MNTKQSAKWKDTEKRTRTVGLKAIDEIRKSLGMKKRASSTSINKREK